MESQLVGRKVRAITTTATAQAVVIEVSAVAEATAAGQLVYGYRQAGRNAGRRQTTYPRLYLIPADGNA